MAEHATAHPFEDDDDPLSLDVAVLARYEVVEAYGLAGLLCRRCPTILLTARDMGGSQRGVTVVDAAEQAMQHEQEKHGLSPARVDYQALLRKYIAHVADVEGVTLIEESRRVGFMPDGVVVFTEAEWAALQALNPVFGG